MCVDVPTTDVVRVSLRDLLRSVPTFQGSFQDITFDRKALIFINENSIDLSQINLEVYTYKSDKDIMLPPYNKTASSSPSDTSLPSACACKVFVDVATKNETMYKQTAREKEANIQKDRAQETIKLL